MKKVLFVATVVKTHLMQFHIPYLKMLKQLGWQTAVAARNDYENPDDCRIPYCDEYFDLPFARNPLHPSNLRAYLALKSIIHKGGYDVIHCHTPTGAPRFEALLGDGSQFGIRLSYQVQPSPDGLAQAFILGEKFLNGEPGAMVLGDNIFYGNGLRTLLKAAVTNAEENGRATVFGYYVPDPERFGVVAFDETGKATSIEEKPKEPKSNYAVTGLYFYPGDVCKRANRITPSARGELEITALNEMYLREGLLDVQLLGRGFAWLDAGMVQSLLQAAEFVQMIQTRQGITISAPEEIAYLSGFIGKEALLKSATAYGKSPYGKHLKAVAEGKAKYWNRASQRR